MKTTSYEISKKLKEARFGKDSAFAHFKSKCGGGGIFYVWEGIKGGYEEEFFSYDLETILDALPDTTEIIISSLTGERIFYLDSNIRGNEVSIAIEENESLADTAGRMWLMLKEKGLV